MDLQRLARQAWKGLPAPGSLKLATATGLYRAHLAAARTLRRPPSEADIQPGPVVVSGFLNEVIGVGRGAAATADALETAGLPVLRHDIRAAVESSPYRRVDVPGGPGGVWIHHCNPPETDLLFNHMPPDVTRRRYLIGYWAWELDRLPRAWRQAARAFHEIWTPSAFVASTVEPHARKVRVMPHPLRAPPAARPARARFELAEGAVAFGVFADARSSLARKNPHGAVEAYLRAFPEADGRAALSVKVVAPEADAAGVAALRALASGRPDIRVWSERLSEGEMASLFASLDVVVSLHRSEGFGLTIAEAYLAGRMAVTTAWSGNLDFVEPEVEGGLTPAALVPVEDPSGQYRGGLWADPDLDAAALRLRRCVDDPAFRIGARLVPPRVEARLQAPWTRAALEAQPWFRHVSS